VTYSYEKKPSKLKRAFILVILMGMVSAISIFLYDMYINIDVSYYSNQKNEPIRVSDEQKIVSYRNVDVTVTLEHATECVVGISKIKNVGSSIVFEDSVGTLGLGTGMIISENGYIITNWHVAGNKYSSCYVTLDSGNVYNGSVLWADMDLDLAVVKINAKGLNYLPLGDSDNVKVGETVYAIGNPIGIEFQRTVTAGIISGLDRTVKIEEETKSSYMEDLIQTDATINPGNSGGPLINRDGEVIGINSIKITEAEGIGFAVPINIIKPIIDSYTTTGSFEEAYLGIFAYDKEVIPYLDNNAKFSSGIYVVQVTDNGPGSKAGLKIGDVIAKIDGIEINKMSELRRYIYKKRPNDSVNITVIRNNNESNLNLVLGKRI